MHRRTSKLCAVAFASFSLALLSVCYSEASPQEITATTHQQLPPGKIVLKIRFDGDYLQLGELATRLKVEIVRQDRPFLYVIGTQAQLESLTAEGLQPELVDPKDFFEQLVRVEPADDKTVDAVRAAGGSLVQREKEYAVFRLTLRELDLLDPTKLKVRPMRESDLVPRFVTIEAPNEATVELILSIGVDIFEAREGRILGRAFDGQIAKLREHGLKVEISTP